MTLVQQILLIVKNFILKFFIAELLLTECRCFYLPEGKFRIF